MNLQKVQPPQEAVVALLSAAHRQLEIETREEIARIEAKETAKSPVLISKNSLRGKERAV
jgi:hypothetical protein